ncbi:MAG: four helix bundle protein [Thermodesulfobacteriota bacterium]
MEFVYEKLEVWKTAVDFGTRAMKLANEKSEDQHLSVIMQGIQKGALNISTAIAKGKGYPSKHDFAKHLYLSRGSVYETMTLIEILKRKAVISNDTYTEFEEMGNKTAAMLSALINSLYKKNENKESKSK